MLASPESTPPDLAILAPSSTRSDSKTQIEQNKTKYPPKALNHEQPNPSLIL